MATGMGFSSVHEVFPARRCVDFGFASWVSGLAWDGIDNGIRWTTRMIMIIRKWHSFNVLTNVEDHIEQG